MSGVITDSHADGAKVKGEIRGMAKPAFPKKKKRITGSFVMTGNQPRNPIPSEQPLLTEWPRITEADSYTA